MKRVLVCDDNEGMLEICEIILEQNNFETVLMRNCEAVLESAMQIKPDVILMDLSVPKMGGAEATIRLKSNPETKNIPVIILSANIEVHKKITYR